MISPVDHELFPLSTRRPRFLLREAADINRVLVHLLTHWKLPAIDARVDRLPALDSQRAQHRFVRLSEDCNCLLGEMLGGTTLLAGSFASWVSERGWHNLGLVAVATLGVTLIGKTMELAWTRIRLLLVLRNLKHRLAEAIAGRIVEMPVKVPEAVPYPRVLNREDGDVLHKDRVRHRHPRHGSHRPRILLREDRDIDRIAWRLFTHWKLPRMVIQIDTLPKSIVQRAQDRMVRLSEGRTFLLAAVLAMASFLIGFARIVWPPRETVLWTLPLGWSAIGWVLIATLCAALSGCAVEMAWTRVRLLWVLLDLQDQIRAAPESGSESAAPDS